MTLVQLDVPDDTWEKYRILVNRSLNLDESVIVLIDQAVKHGKTIERKSEEA